MNEQKISNLLVHLSLWSVLKVFILLAFFIYICFAFIVVRQVLIMTKVISGPADFFLKFLSFLLLGISITIFIVVLVYL